MPQLKSSCLERVVVVQTAFLGDALLTLPMIRALKRNYPVRELYIIATPETAEVFQQLEEIDETIILNKRGTAHRQAFATTRRVLAHRNLTCAILPHRSIRSWWLARSSGIQTIVGFSTSPVAMFYSRRIRYHVASPEAIRILSLLSVFERGTSENTGWFSSTPLNTHQRKIHIVIAPGSRWETKKMDP